MILIIILDTDCERRERMITIIKPQEKSPVLKFNESNLAHNKMSITDTVFDVMVEQQKKINNNNRQRKEINQY
ncbi:predicted protein [Enterococcus faecium 1,230,933]|nr:predicted protein [Enterococcus faecium 1,230,933]